MDTVRLDWRRSLAIFQPTQVFGYERWRATKHGTIEWQVFVLQAAAPGALCSKVPGVLPGAVPLLVSRGKTRAQRALLALDRVAANKKLEDVSPEFWLRLSHRLQARMPLEPFLEREFFCC